MAVRRNVLSLDAGERSNLLAGLKKLQSINRYNYFIRVHARATEWKSLNGTTLNAAHMGPAFLPWHRKFILDFENALRKNMNNPEFGLPYYDWTDGLGAASPVWGNDLMGGAGSPVTGPFAPASWQTVDSHIKPTAGLNRFLGGEASLPTRADVHRLMYRREYDAVPYSEFSETGMRNELEGFQPFGLHNAVHVWIGGQMSNVPVAPNDPVFFLHHCNVDRVWTQWQLVNPSASYVPTSGGAQGQNLNDRMYPWKKTRPSDLLSISDLGYSYDSYYQIGTLQIIITTGSSTFSGTDDEVQLALRSSSGTGPYWSSILDASHCDHPNPFERGQTDTFTFKNITEERPSGVPLTPAALQSFSLGKALDGSWVGRGDWTVAGVKIVADGLVLYDNQSLNQLLNNKHTYLNDGHGNALNTKP